MRLPTALVALAGAAAAAPVAESETITVGNFLIRRASATDRTIISAGFSWGAAGAHQVGCSAANPGFPSPLLPCADAAYSFSLSPAADGFHPFSCHIEHRLQDG